LIETVGANMAFMPRIAVIALSLSLVACGDGPSANAVSLEATPLVLALAEPRVAFTFAQVRNSTGHVATLLVTKFNQETVQATDLTSLGAPLDADPFDVMSKLGPSGLEAALQAPAYRSYAITDLLPAAGDGRRHVATGTNFREHAKEAEIDEVFNFPKFGPATPARTSVMLKPGALLDYEVEICARFDRDIRSVGDFDAARKGFFLCGDFTDRARLLRLVNPQDVGSGEGFSDAKSAKDFFPTGPFLVVPRDWRSFVRSERMTTQVNREVRQDARGGEMILDFRGIVQKAVTNGGGGTYTYRRSRIPLLTNGRIVRGAAVMSGTSEGVIFMPPRAKDFIAGGARYIATGPMLRGDSAYRALIEGFIEKEQHSGRYLRSGDVVTHGSSSMGDVVVRVVSPPPVRPAGAGANAHPPLSTRS
jgi:2-keto-4-pentenoate hydratase/2-oxohepta-3-ene-1,7-dioic acid hydratase in catechol pathway